MLYPREAFADMENQAITPKRKLPNFAGSQITRAFAETWDLHHQRLFCALQLLCFTQLRIQKKRLLGLSNLSKEVTFHTGQLDLHGTGSGDRNPCIELDITWTPEGGGPGIPRESCSPQSCRSWIPGFLLMLVGWDPSPGRKSCVQKLKQFKFLVGLPSILMKHFQLIT